VVGDDDQSIYGFRAALGFRGMESFAETFDATRIVLGSNYRCRSEILAAADRLIQHNAERIPKVLKAEKGPGGKLSALRHVDEYAEAIAGVEDLQPRLADGRSCAVLTRTNRHLDAIEAVCRSHGVPYFRASGKSILDRPEAALFCNLLELIEGRKRSGLDSLLAHTQMSLNDLRLLRAEAANRDPAKKKDLVDRGVSEEASTIYRSLIKRLAEWESVAKREFYSLALEGAKEWMLSYASTDNAIRAIDTTYEVISRLNGPFSERIEFLKRDNNEPKPGALVLTTMHSSKGLEWDDVWICRAEENVVPDGKSPESEERRLFYVAMTRARDRLTVSSTQKNLASRFFVEAGFDSDSQV